MKTLFGILVTVLITVILIQPVLRHLMVLIEPVSTTLGGR